MINYLSEHLSSNRLKVDERVAGVSHVIQLTPVRRHDSQSLGEIEYLVL